MPANRHTFRLFGPDETASNRLQAVFEVTDRAWDAAPCRRRRPPGPRRPGDGGALRAPVPGLARGLPADRPPRPVQLLRGVHPHRRLDVQPARQVAEGRAPTSPGAARWPRSTTSCRATSGARTTTASPTRTRASSTTWSTRRRRSSGSTCRPTPTACLSVADHCLRSRDYVNVIVAGKQPQPDWLDVEEAVDHCTRGLGIWDFASNDHGAVPDVVMACCGDVPTLETLAAVDLLRRHLPELRGPGGQRGRPDAPRARHRAPPRAVATPSSTPSSPRDRPVIFAFHGYPTLIHRLTYRRTNHAQPPRPGLQGGGDHHHALRHGHAQRPRPLPPGHRRASTGCPACAGRTAGLRQEMVDARLEARRYTREHGEDPPEITDWRWVP